MILPNFSTFVPTLGELLAVRTVPGSTAGSAVFIGAARGGRRSDLPETAETVTRAVWKLGDVGLLKASPPEEKDATAETPPLHLVG
jgi:predicted aconitase with swiveling domain